MISAIRNHAHYHHLPFFIVLVFQLLAYNYFFVMDELPVSAHIWRQTDCLAFAMNYYNNGMNFFEPQVFQALNGNGYTAAEFPGMYYLIALLFKIFGPSELVYRLTWTIVLVAGLFCLYRTLLMLLRDLFWATTTTALLFCSPVLIFYGNSFIIDPVALSFSFIGAYFITRYYFTRRLGNKVLAIVFFTIGALSKETSMLLFMAILALLFVVESKQLYHKRKSLAQSVLRGLPYLIPFLAVSVYYAWRVNYNEVNPNLMFLAKVLPIWELNVEEKEVVIGQVKAFWLGDYFDKLTLMLTALIFVVNFYFFKKNIWANLFSITLFLGMLSVIALFFPQFKNHDYYIIILLPVIPIVWATFAMNIKESGLLNATQMKFVKGGFALLLLLNVLYGGTRQANRYNSQKYWDTAMLEKWRSMKELSNRWSEFGVKTEDKIISVPDYTPNTSLYHLNRQGWSNYYNGGYYGEKELRENIAMGAKYLVVSDSNELSKGYLQPFLTSKLGEHNGLTVYRLTGSN